MSEVKNKKKKSSIIQVSIGILAVILAILIIIMMGIVSDIQGTARIVNYTGLVRGVPNLCYFHLFFMKFSLGFFLLKDFLLAFTADGRNKNLSL